MASIVLRIKKKYFDQIRDGIKTIEYRDVKPYYARMFEGRSIEEVRFHYQGGLWLTCDIVKIEIIATPQVCLDSGIPFSDRVYALHLKAKKPASQETHRKAEHA